MQANAAESALYKEVGPEKYLEYMHDYFYNANAPMMEGFWDKPFKERAIAAINAPRMFHDCRMKILGEDDEKLWFVMDPCGAGTKLWNMGLCKEGLGLCDKPSKITAGGKNFPVYCTHAPIAEIVCGELGVPYQYQPGVPRAGRPLLLRVLRLQGSEGHPRQLFRARRSASSRNLQEVRRLNHGTQVSRAV